MSEPDSDSDTAPRRSRRSRGAAVLRMIVDWTPTILLSIVAPIVTYDVLSARGMSDVLALVLSGVGPTVQMLGSLIIRRKADEFSIFALIFLVLGVVTALLFDDPRLLFVKDSAVTGLFGLVLLSSLLTARPLMFYFGRRFATDGTPERVAWWNGLWQYPDFRRSQRVITVVWGLAYLGEGIARIVLAFFLSVPVMVVITNVLPIVVTAALIAVTIVYGRRQAAAGARRRAEAAAAGRPLATGT